MTVDLFSGVRADAAAELDFEVGGHVAVAEAAGRAKSVDKLDKERSEVKLIASSHFLYRVTKLV